jgi:hypothetical protein
LGWSPKNGVLSYTIQYKLSTNNNWTTITASSNTFNLTGLTAGRTYQWKVKSSCSNYSGTISFNTPAATTSTTKKNNRIIGSDNLFDIEQNVFSIYPNPSMYEVRLKIEANDEIGEGAFYRITDLRGNQKIFIRAIHDEEFVDVSSLQEGTYIVQFVGKSGKVSTQRLIKQ